MTKEQIFKSVLPYKNFVTDEVVGYYGNDDYVCELSYGRAMDVYIFGVTFVSIKTMQRVMELDKSFTNDKKDCAKKSAQAYIMETIGNLN